MHTIKKLALGLALLLTLTACAGPAASSPSPSPQPAALLDSQALAALVDWQADEYLAGTFETREEALQNLTLRELYTGLTLEDGTAATMALFTVLNTPHAAGFQRTVVLLLDAEMQPLGQFTVQADSLETYLLDWHYVLFLGTSDSAAYHGSKLTVLNATPSGWEDLSEEVLTAAGLPAEETQELYYSYSLGQLHIFETTNLDDPFQRPEHRYLRSLGLGLRLDGFKLYELLPYGQ